MKRTGLWFVFIPLILAGLIMSACSTPEPCNVQSERFIQDTASLMNRWYFAYDAAVVTASGDDFAPLTEQIGELQTLRSEVDILEPPDCANQVKVLMILHMDAAIEGLGSLSRGEDTEVAALKITSAETGLQNFADEFTLLVAGTAPYD